MEVGVEVVGLDDEEVDAVVEVDDGDDEDDKGEEVEVEVDGET